VTAKPWDSAQACVQLVDHGENKPLTLAEAVDRVGLPLERLTRTELVQVIAFLSCQVIGARRSLNADAALAMSQIATIAREYERRQEDAA
jgi:hypothetical protein